MKGFITSDGKKKKKGEKSTLTGGLDVVGFDAKGKDHFQACALSYFWIFFTSGRRSRGHRRFD